ncbi:MAG: AAA family ATPase, partial [Woeseiaceae bacterium]|nr:AAA family ATPase [Woeseiaceae bacterium]
MKSLKKALAATDAVVAVTGVAGVGKSTLVRRALDAIPGEKHLVRIGRMQLGHDEILEFLLEEFGAGDLPKSTIRKINLFRDLLTERTQNGARVIIVVEDAVRIGQDALAELESLTAADADQHDGANLVLMGDEALLQQLSDPALLRLKQRTRLRHAVTPLSASELLGYLKHCFRLAGNEFDIIFGPGCDKVLFAHSQGNPRVANNLVEAVLTAAAEQGVAKIDTALIKTVATEEFGLTADTTIIEPQPAESTPTAPPQPAAKPEPVTQPEEAAAPEATPSEAAEPTARAEAAAKDDDIPELIQDTLPDLEVLAPGLAAKGLVISPESEPEPEPARAPDAPPAPGAAADDDIPTLFESARIAAPQQA